MSNAAVSTTKSSRTPLIVLSIGIVSMIAWVIPVIGAILTIIGIILGFRKSKIGPNLKTTIGLILCIIGLLASVANGTIGAINGYNSSVASQQSIKTFKSVVINNDLSVSELIGITDGDAHFNEKSFYGVIYNGNVELLKSFLAKRRYFANAKDSTGKTMLMLAAILGKTEIVDLLLKKGAQINAKEPDSTTAIMYAALNGHKEVSDLLIKKNAELDLRNIAAYGVIGGNKDIVKTLIEKGASINWRNADGLTLIDLAVKNGNNDVAEILIEKGANINEKNGNGETPLMVATREGQTDMVEFLIGKNARINDKSSNGSTALMLAADNGKADIVKILLDHEADMDVVNDDGKRAPEFALNNGDPTTLDLFMPKLLEDPKFFNHYNKVKSMFIGIFSKYESSSANAYALAGLSSQTTSTYTFKSDGTYLYRVKSVESTPTLRSNMTEDEKGTWRLNISDASITLNCEGKRTLDSDLKVQAKYGVINNQGGDAEWESCENSTSFTIDKLKEEGYRKLR